MRLSGMTNILAIYFVFFCTSILSAQSRTCIAQFEELMQGSAKFWLEQEYFSAMDSFQEARRLLDDNLPDPNDAFKWQAHSTLKTYCLLMMRLVEAHYYRSVDRHDRLCDTVRQAGRWARMLEKQTADWSALEDSDLEQMKFRNKWLNRVIQALNQEKQFRRIADEVLRDD